MRTESIASLLRREDFASGLCNCDGFEPADGAFGTVLAASKGLTTILGTRRLFGFAFAACGELEVFRDGGAFGSIHFTAQFWLSAFLLEEATSV